MIAVNCNNKSNISKLDSPLYQCSKVVTIIDFIPNATLDVKIGSAPPVITGADGGFPVPNGRTLLLPSALVVGNVIQARQHFEGATSNSSEPVTVRDHTEDYPTGHKTPVPYFMKSRPMEMQEAVEFLVKTSEDFPIRALSPALFVGDFPVTEGGRVNENLYRFVTPAPEIESLEISIGWAGENKDKFSIPSSVRRK